MSAFTPDLLVVQAVGPEDLNTAANDGTYVSMKDYRAMEIHIFIGDIAGGAAAVTVEQSTDTSATGEKAVSFTKYYQTGQRINITGQSGTFSVGETITGGTSTNTAKVIKISSTHLIVAFLTGTTTWTNGETITGGTSTATALVSGTGQDEDTLVEMTASGNTFSTIAVAFKHYMIPITSDMLDKNNGFDCCHVKVAQAATSETQGCAFYVMKDPVHTIYPQRSAIDAVKIV